MVKILQGMLIVDHFCEGLNISTFHGKLRLGYLALALFEVQTKDKGPFKTNTRKFFFMFCFGFFYQINNAHVLPICPAAKIHECVYA